MNIQEKRNIIKIKNSITIEYVLSKGKKVFTKYGILFTKEHSGTNEFAILIKKNVGFAVHRNYCKRLLREYIRNHKYLFLKNEIIVFLYMYPGKIDYNSLKSELSRKITNR